MNIIDIHVHLRDFKERYKGETVAHGLEVARDSGVVAVFDMPNTNPSIINRELVLDRLKLARDANVPEVFYGLYIGLTADTEQVKKAVDIYREFDQVVGMKFFAGHSVGDLGITKIEDQEKVHETLVQEGYEGVVVYHAEKEGEMHPHLWNPLNPITHCHARPESAEVESVRDLIGMAKKYKFRGKMHIAHISSPKSVELVVGAKTKGLDISSGVCPHHLIYDWSKMNSKDGLLLKMNPPLRSPESRKQIFQYLYEGKVDWIETDHALHTLDEKIKEPFMSGIPGLAWWSIFEEFLRQENFSDAQIEEITFSNAAERFNLDILQKKPRRLIDRRGDYPFNPYEPMEKELSWRRLER